MDTPGNIEFLDVHVEGDQEAKAYIGRVEDNLGPWLARVANHVAEHAHELAERNAAGVSKKFAAQSLIHMVPMMKVGSGGLTEPRDATVGVTPGIPNDIWKYKGGKGADAIYVKEQPEQVPGGSDPHDFPVFLELGIAKKPRPNGGLMAWGPPGNRRFAEYTEQREGRHYVRRAWEDTRAWLPMGVREKAPELGAL